MLLIREKKPSVPETLLKKKKQREVLLQKRLKSAALLRKVLRVIYNITSRDVPDIRFRLAGYPAIF